MTRIEKQGPKASKGVKKPKATTSTSVVVNHNRNIKNSKVSKEN